MFNEIKKVTNGYMDAAVYKKIYQYALNAPSGNIVDIGPAQGASTICFGLAAKENKEIEHIYSIDKFYLSVALEDFLSVEKNVKKLKKNLEKYKCEKDVTIIVAGNEPEELNEKTFSLLFIDADGALDRDFIKYYNNLVSEGIIIIDDCEKILNIQTTSRNLKFQFQYQVDNYLKWIKIPNIEDYTPLGKQYTTYRFVEYFKNNNFIEIIEEIDGTIFARKSRDAKLLNNDNIKELNSIRKEIVRLYNNLRNRIRSIYDNIEGELVEFANQMKVHNVILYESSYYAVKSKYQFNKIYEWHVEKNGYFNDDYRIQTIQEDRMLDIFKKLVKNIIVEKQLDEEGSNPIEKYLYKNGYRKILYVPLFYNENILGFVIIFEEKNFEFNLNSNNQLKLADAFSEVRESSDSYIEKMIEII